MSPDYQILSIYVDGELPSPWKEKMEAHLSSCTECSAQLERFRLCSQVLRGAMPVGDFRDSAQVMEAAQDRVWQKVRSLNGNWNRKQRKTIWERTISVPIPAAVAAAVVFFVVSAVLVIKQPSSVPQNQDIMVDSRMVDQGIVPVSNINDVLQYLGNQDTADIVIIRLPETRSFSSFGEPTIIKAADYVRKTDYR